MASMPAAMFLIAAACSSTAVASSADSRVASKAPA
jgi:hypothetical protein